jgi:hypothetical protein
MMVVVLWIPLHWIADVLEATGAIAAILIAGAAIAVGAFWLLYRAVGKLAGPSLEWATESESDSEENSEYMPESEADRERLQ